MTTTRTQLIAALLLTACGGTASGTDPGLSGQSLGGSLPSSGTPNTEQAGSRLHRVWRKGTDNSVTSAGYYDATLNKRCSFQSVGGALELCVPEDVYTLSNDEWNSIYSTSNRSLFTDPTCKNANVAVLSKLPCANYGLVRVLPDLTSKSVSACEGEPGPSWFLATPLPAGAQVYYYGVPAGGGQCCSCQPYTGAPAGSTLMKMERLLDSNVDQTALVRAQLSVDP